MLDEYTAQKKDLGDRHNLALAEAKRAAAAADAERRRARNSIQKRETGNGRWRGNARRVAAGLAVAKESEKLLPGILAEVAAIESQLESGNFAVEARARRAEFEGWLRKDRL